MLMQQDFEELSKRWQMEAAFYHSYLHFWRLLEKLPAGAYACDPEGLITYFNEHAVQLWGRKPKLNDAVDRFCGSFKLFTPDGAKIDHSQCWMALALKNQAEYNGREIIVERPDGSRLTVLAHANPVHDASGKLLGAVNVLVDISARKRAETALQATDRAKNEFLATLAHELRNPLAPIRSAVGILRQKDEQPETQAALAVIERQMDQMTRLIDDLIDLARITNNQLEVRREPVALADVLQLAVETSQPLIEMGGQTFVQSMPDEPIFLYGDVTRLVQVISNLLNNATKYSGPNDTIWFTAEKSSTEAVITVRDSGQGISADLLPNIFEMFTHVLAGEAKPMSGLGIGLTLAKRMVEMHDGRLLAHSAGVGQGSTFTIHLPLLLGFTPKSVPDSPTEEIDEQTAVCRILIVDDNRDVADGLAEYLQMMGHEVHSTYDGLRAIAMAKTLQPDIMLLDIGMSDMDGYEVAKRIRQHSWSKNIFLIAHTGWGQEDDKKRVQEAGFDHHIVKPIRPGELKDLMSQLAKRKLANS